MSKKSVALRLIDVDLMVPHPRIQHEWAFNPKLARAIGANYHEERAGVIDAVPLTREECAKFNGMKPTPEFGIFVGRHRHAGAKLAGVRVMRVDVHHGLDLADMAALKVAKDRDRRRVTAVETFLDAVTAGESEAVRIKAVAESLGYEIGCAGRNKPASRIEAVQALRRINRRDKDQLRRVLELNKLWWDEPGTNQKFWLLGVDLFVANGFADRLTAAGRERLATLLPMKTLRKAKGTSMSFGGGSGGVEPAQVVAEEMRKAARLRRKR